MRIPRRLLILSLLPGLCFAEVGSSAPEKVRVADLSELIANARLVSSTRKVAVPTPMGAEHRPEVEWRGDAGKEMARVAALPPVEVEANGNDLHSFIRTVCEKADMDFTILGDDRTFSTPVTRSSKGPPWQILQSVARLYNLEIAYRNGTWEIYAADSDELVQRTYLLRNNTLETFTANGGSSGGNTTGYDSSQRGDRQTPAGNQQLSSQQGGSGGLSIDRTGMSVFTTDSKTITDTIQQFLSLNVRPGSLAASDGSFGAPAPRRSESKDDQSQPQRKGFVHFDSATNTVFVMATRAQHELIAAWIAQIDQPQKQVQLETKILLTGVSPQSHRGLHNPLMDDRGVSVGLTGLQREGVDLGDSSTWKMPRGVLKTSDLEATLSLSSSLTNTSTVQYPTQVTLSGQEVTLRSVKQYPVVSSNLNNAVGTGVLSQSNVTVEDIGTVVAILPKVLDGRNVLLNVSIEVSHFSETVIINGNTYPVVQKQIYLTHAIAPVGYSLALGGLEEAITSTATQKIPWWGDIPFFGFLAKDITDTRTHNVLTMVITPQIMDEYGGGNMTGIAQHTLPARPMVDRVPFEKGAAGSIDDVALSLRGFSRDIDELAQIVKEGRGDKRTLARAKLLINELELMTAALKRNRAQGRAAPALEAEVTGFRTRLYEVAKSTPRIDPLS